MTRARVTEFRKLLEARRLELTTALKPTRCGSACPNHDERRMEAETTEFRLVVTKRAADLRQAEKALERLERGEYGTCTECGNGITVERLRALPVAERCAGCEKAREMHFRPKLLLRPIYTT